MTNFIAKDDGNWWPTATLRFVERQGPSLDTWPHPKTYRILQQLWRSSMGQDHWQDVPVEKEDV